MIGCHGNHEPDLCAEKRGLPAECRSPVNDVSKRKPGSHMTVATSEAKDHPCKSIDCRDPV
jgi:hypothetical protein